jgi:tetratricopeptide (TPR) repeat protein
MALAVIVASLVMPSVVRGQTGGQDTNALMMKAQTAIDSKKWNEAITPLEQMIGADPTQWAPYQKLGFVQFALGRYNDAIRTYEKGIEVAQSMISVPATADAVKAGIGQMLAGEGNAYLKLRKDTEAITAWTRAAEISPNKSVAYFNICATLYNTGNMERAVVACEKASAIDPTRADTYFIIGSAKFSSGTLDSKTNAYRTPPGTIEALKKYLELAPAGPHAKDVKEMIDMIGGEK